jgi:hypothetical protein
MAQSSARDRDLLTHRLAGRGLLRLTKKFWKMTRRELRQGHVEAVFQIAMVVHYLITFGRECLTRDVQASAYSVRGREEHTQMAGFQRGCNETLSGA